MEELKIWKNYRKLFPSRYLENSAFDDYLKSQNFYGKRLLSVGGGNKKPEYLNEVDLLDPYVSDTDFNEHITWNTLKTYDVVIARGSINYLLTIEYTRLQRFLIDGGELIFNTFLKRPVNKTIVGVTLGGEITQEKIEVVADIIKHKLVVNEHTIEHNIYYRTLDFFYRLDRLKELKVTNYGKNSAIIHIII